MTDLSIDPAAFVAADDELVFDDEAELAPPPPKAVRKAPRKGRAADVPIETESAAVPETKAEEPADAPAPIPPTDAATAGSDPSAAPISQRHRIPVLLAAIVLFALLTSLISLGALIAVGRSLAAANAERARTTAQADAMARIPDIARSLDAASTRLAQIAAAIPARTTPATQADVNGAIDGLKLALAQRQPAGVTPITGALHDGFSEIDAHLGRIEDRLPAQRAGSH